jgi:hypothetical protein
MACLTYAAMQMWSLKRDNPAPLPPELRPPQGVPLELTTARAYAITLPKTTEWQPQLAGRFMEQLLHKMGRLTFQIVAENGHVSWRILDLRRKLDPSVIHQTVLNFYPDAQIEVGGVPTNGFAGPFYRYVMAFEQMADPLLPIAYVEELKPLDPLVNLTQEISGLAPGERIIYTLFVADPAGFVYDQAENLLTVKPDTNPFQLLSPAGWFDAGFNLTAQEAQRLAVYEPKVQQVIETKLTNLVYQCLLLIQVDAPTQERVETLSHIDSQILQYKNFPFNALLWYKEPWPDCIQFIDAPDKDAATNIWGLLDSWLTNRSRKWQGFRLLLDSHELAALWHLPHSGIASSQITWTPKRGQIPQVMRGQKQGVRLGVNVYAGQEDEVFISDEDRATHINILGMTGVGKSTLLHHLVHQDIAVGNGVAVIDPHGRLVRDILQTSIPDEREQDVVVLDLASGEYPPPLNPMGGAHSRTAVTRIISILDKVYGGWENAPRMANALSSALMTLRQEPQATVRDVARLFLDETYRARLVERVDDETVAEFWEYEYENFSEGQQQQIRDPVVYRMRAFYGNADLYPIVCHPDRLDFGTLMHQGRIILLSLGMDEERIPERERNLLGAMVVSQLQMAAMGSVGRARPFYLYIDEVQNFVTSALNEVFSEARKFGLSLVVANQYLKQLAGETLDAMMGNVGAMVTFQCGLDDARKLAPYVKPAFEAEDLVNLDKYQAVVKMRHQGLTQAAFSLTGQKPLPKPCDAEEREQRIRELSVQRYTTKSREEVMAWLSMRYPRRSKGTPGEPSFYEQ